MLVMRLNFRRVSARYTPTTPPGGELRIIQKAVGIRYTIVNGTVTFEESVCTDATPGKLLRSYDMKVT